MAKIHEAICNIMNDITAIGKDQRNAAQGYQFRGIDTVYNEIHNVLAKHKVFTVPTVISETHEERQSKNGGTLIYRVLKIKYTFYSDDGSSFDAVVIGEGMDSSDKASNKAQAVAHKYALLQVFCIPTEEAKDPEVDSHEPVAKTVTVSDATKTRIAGLTKNGIKGKDCLTTYLADFNTAKKVNYKPGDLTTDERLSAVMDFIDSIPPKV